MSQYVEDLFNDLKQVVLGTKTAKIDSILDKAADDILQYKSSDVNFKSSYVDTLKSLTMKARMTSDGASYMGLGAAPTPATYGQAERLVRYRAYESVVTYINHCSRALDVIADNIMSPDDINKSSLDIVPRTNVPDSVQSMNEEISTARAIIDKIDLESQLYDLIYNTVLFGDYFCEITNSKNALLSRSILTENSVFDRMKQDGAVFKDKISVSEDREITVVTDCSLMFEDLTENSGLDFSNVKSSFLFEDDFSMIEDDDKLDINDIKLIFYKPDRVVKLQTDLYPICLGYLIFPRMTHTGNPMNIQDEIVNKVCLTILKNISTNLDLKNDNGDIKDIKELVRNMIANTDRAYFNIRYVPAARMQHFKNPSSRFYPYGCSIFDASLFTSKILISLETALAIHRLNSSTEKRKITYDLGISRDAKNQAENLREMLKKRKICLDQFGSVDTIPSMITTFEDMYVPVYNGKEAVTISNMNDQMIDTRSKVDELKYLRDSIIASLSVPPSFVGVEENLSNRNGLAEENILFARTIVKHQKYISQQIEELVRKVMILAGKTGSLSMFDHISIVLPSPKNLQYEREAKSLNDLVGVIEALERIGVPKDWSKKKYLTSIDWQEVENFEIDNRIEKIGGIQDKPEDDMGGGMGMGMGMPMGGGMI